MHQHFTAKSRGSELDYQAICNVVPGNFYVLKPDPPLYTVLAVSDDLLRLLEMERSMVVGKSIFEFFPENPGVDSSGGTEVLKASLGKVLQTKEPDATPAFQKVILNAEGILEERYWSASSRPVLDADGKVIYLIHTATDVTAQVKYERREVAHKNIEKKYSLFMQAPVAVCIVTGPDNIVELANEESLKILNRTSEIIGKSFFDVIPEAREQGFPELLEQVRKTGMPFHGREQPVRLLVGGKEEVRYYNFIYKPFYENLNDQLAKGVFSVSHDVTDQVLARKKVEESEKQVRSFIESSRHPIGVYIGREMRIELANQAFKDGIGKGDDVAGKLYSEVLPELENQEVFEQLDNVYTTGIPFQAKNYHLSLIIDGKPRSYFYDLSFTPLHNTAGEVYGIINTGADVTELNLARERAAVNEARFQNLVREASVGIIVLVGEQMLVEVVNQAYARLVGHTIEELKGKQLFKVLPEAQEKFKPIIDKVRQTGEPIYLYEHPYAVYTDGEKKEGFLNLVYQPYHDMDGSVIGVMVLCHDVTKQVLAARRIEESAAELSNLANAMPQIVWIANAKGKVIYYNKRVSEFSGAKQMPDGTWTWKSLLISDDKQATEEAWKYAVRTGTPYEVKHRLKMKDGTYRWHLSRAYPLRDQDGNIIKWYGTATDVHAQKENEEALELKNLQLTRVNEDLDSFIYTASHDLKAPIYNIEGLLAVLSTDFATVSLQDEEVQHIMSMMKQAVNRFKKTIEVLTDISRLQNQVTKYDELVRLRAILDDVMLDMQGAISSSQAVLHVKVPRRSNIRFSEKNLRSIFYNLLSNAIKYRSQDRQLHVHISCEAITGFKLLTVSDNGLGIDPSQMQDLFVMFKRLHDHVEGTGVGLYMVKRIVENAGGRIEVESHLGVGSVFKVFLPFE